MREDVWLGLLQPASSLKGTSKHSSNRERYEAGATLFSWGCMAGRGGQFRSAFEGYEGLTAEIVAVRAAMISAIVKSI
jgi:hypothetical protein